MGYHATTATPAIMHPSAAAAFPSIKIKLLLLSIGWRTNGSSFGRCCSANSTPTLIAPWLSAITAGLRPNCLRIAFSISATSMLRSLASTPS